MCATVIGAPAVTDPVNTKGARDICPRNRLMSVRSSVMCTAFTAVTCGVSVLSVNVNDGKSAKLIDGVVVFAVTAMSVPDMTQAGKTHPGANGMLLYSRPE